MNAGGMGAAIIAGVVRAGLSWLSGRGVDLGSEQVDQLVDAALIIVPIIWSVLHKVKVDDAIKSAKAGV